MTDPSYNKSYWMANRLRLLKERAERYRKDKKYRDAALARSKARVALSKLVRATRVVRVLHDGIHEPVFTLTQLSQQVDRKKEVIYSWKKDQILPPPMYQSGSGKALYAESQVAYLRELLRRVDKEDLFIIYPIMTKVLKKVWLETYDPQRLTVEINEEMVDEKDYEARLDRCPSNSVRGGKRKDKADERKAPKVQGRARGRARKHGNHPEHGKLPKPATRRRSRPALFTCFGRSSFRNSF